MRNLTRNWQKKNSHYIVAERLTEVYPTVKCKVELESDELGYFSGRESQEKC